jgi:DNA-binding beta-propeller fold protein YncE
MSIIDANNGRAVANTPVGDGPDAVAFDPSGGLIFSSNGESGDLTVTEQITPGKYQALQTVKTQLGGRTLAFDKSSKSVYVVSAKLGPKPAPSKENPKAKPTIMPDSFFLLVFRR